MYVYVCVCVCVCVLARAHARTHAHAQTYLSNCHACSFKFSSWALTHQHSTEAC
jgi:hypothetical protein